MDKEVAKRLMRDRGLPVVEYYLARDDAQNPFGYPVFVKPANLGSSVGISKASNEEELGKAIALARQYDRKVLVERGIIGQEIECSVLGNEEPIAAEPCEVLPFKDFYDYEDKYILDKTQFRIPPALPRDKIDEVRRLAVECFRALECEIMARVDFLFEAATAKLYVNEINTIPGFTSISMYPKMWDHAGVPYPALLDRLIELAIERQQRRRALKYSR
jgi:D-alanine-D-alanine ligase